MDSLISETEMWEMLTSVWWVIDWYFMSQNRSTDIPSQLLWGAGPLTDWSRSLGVKRLSCKGDCETPASLPVEQDSILFSGWAQTSGLGAQVLPAFPALTTGLSAGLWLVLLVRPGALKETFLQARQGTRLSPGRLKIGWHQGQAKRVRSALAGALSLRSVFSVQAAQREHEQEKAWHWRSHILLRWERADVRAPSGSQLVQLPYHQIPPRSSRNGLS